MSWSDGTSLSFMLLRGSWLARFPGEHSLALGTRGLHDESPLGFGGLWSGEHVNFLLPYQAHFRAVQIPRPSQFEAVGRRWSIGCAKGDDESVDAFSHLKQIVERRSAPPHVSFCSW